MYKRNNHPDSFYDKMKKVKASFFKKLEDGDIIYMDGEPYEARREGKTYVLIPK